MPPGPQDWWFKKHLLQCGGKFIKIIEPPEKIKPEKMKILASKKKKVGSKRTPEPESLHEGTKTIINIEKSLFVNDQ